MRNDARREFSASLDDAQAVFLGIFEPSWPRTSAQRFSEPAARIPSRGIDMPARSSVALGDTTKKVQQANDGRPEPVRSSERISRNSCQFIAKESHG